MGRDAQRIESGCDKYNKTQLDVATAFDRLIIHRDMAAHLNRWGHVVFKAVGTKKDKVVLDIGSGSRQLAMCMYTNRHQPKEYHSVDLRDREPVPDFSTKCGFTNKHYKQDVTKDLPKVSPDIVVCFEVIEHMDKSKGLELLKALDEAMVEGSTLYLSTPCYDGVTMADNHIYEWKYDELREELEKHFRLVDMFGTFMHTKNLEEDLAGLIHPAVIGKLREFYGTNTLSPIFAPLVPHKSRNVMWILKKKPTQT